MFFLEMSKISTDATNDFRELVCRTLETWFPRTMSGPGERANCDALNCGARAYLHDDFNDIRLKEKLIAEPPVILWPDLVAAENVAPDIREQLIEQL